MPVKVHISFRDSAGTGAESQEVHTTITDDTVIIEKMDTRMVLSTHSVEKIASIIGTARKIS